MRQSRPVSALEGPVLAPVADGARATVETPAQFSYGWEPQESERWWSLYKQVLAVAADRSRIERWAVPLERPPGREWGPAQLIRRKSVQVRSAQVWNGAYAVSRSLPKRILSLQEQRVPREGPPVGEPGEVVVIDDEELPERIERPA